MEIRCVDEDLEIFFVFGRRDVFPEDVLEDLLDKGIIETYYIKRIGYGDSLIIVSNCRDYTKLEKELNRAGEVVSGLGENWDFKNTIVDVKDLEL